MKNTIETAVDNLFLFYGKQNETGRKRLYVQVFAGIPENLRAPTLKKVIIENRFLPSISELFDAAESLAGTLVPELADLTWAEAWSEVYRAIRQGGRKKFSRPLITKAVDSIGWNAFCTCPDKEMGVLRAQFRDIYQGLLQRDRTERYNKFCLGLSSSFLLDGGDKCEALYGGNQRPVPASTRRQ